MGRLENKFLWSLSREAKFARCRREYYLSAYGTWGGWEEDADEVSRLCYRLSKMHNLDTWAGQIVHDAIGGVIHRILDGRGGRTSSKSPSTSWRRPDAGRSRPIASRRAWSI